MCHNPQVVTNAAMYYVQTPFLEETTLGPKILAAILNLFEMGLPGKKLHGGCMPCMILRLQKTP